MKSEGEAFACAREACQNLEALQKFSLEICGRYDREKALLWMCEEVGELIQAIRQGKAMDDVKAEYGDLLLWVISLSNILGLSLADAATGAFLKEIVRQFSAYGELKYLSR